MDWRLVFETIGLLLEGFDVSTCFVGKLETLQGICQLVGGGLAACWWLNALGFVLLNDMSGWCRVSATFEFVSTSELWTWALIVFE